MAIVVVIGLVRLTRAGRWRKSAFDEAPPREGSMHMGDACIAVGVWLLAMIAGVMIAGAHDPDASPQAMVQSMAAGGLGGPPRSGKIRSMITYPTQERIFPSPPRTL